MFQQDLAPHEHQDQAAGQLRPGLAPGAHNGPGLDPVSYTHLVRIIIICKGRLKPIFPSETKKPSAGRPTNCEPSKAGRSWKGGARKRADDVLLFHRNKRTSEQSGLCSDVVRLKGLEPTRIAAREPKSRMSTNSITGAYSIFPLC